MGCGVNQTNWLKMPTSPSFGFDFPGDGGQALAYEYSLMGRMVRPPVIHSTRRDAFYSVSAQITMFNPKLRCRFRLQTLVIWMPLRKLIPQSQCPSFLFRSTGQFR